MSSEALNSIIFLKLLDTTIETSQNSYQFVRKKADIYCTLSDNYCTLSDNNNINYINSNYM